MILYTKSMKITTFHEFSSWCRTLSLLELSPMNFLGHETLRKWNYIVLSPIWREDIEIQRLVAEQWSKTCTKNINRYRPLPAEICRGGKEYCSRAQLDLRKAVSTSHVNTLNCKERPTQHELHTTHCTRAHTYDTPAAADVTYNWNIARSARNL